jgi:molybdate transport system substrate-binding protein
MNPIPMPVLRRLRVAGLATITALAALFAGTARADEVVVFAAASLADALQEVTQAWSKETGHTVKTSFAASSTLARQIENGAPANVFISADEAWMDYLVQRKLTANGTRVDLLGNRLVLVVPADRPKQVELRPGFDLAGLLGADGRLATGDPAHVPVGRYAQEALTRLGVWDLAQARLVRADSVRSALVFVERGEVPAGIVYETDAAISKKVSIAGVFPASSHPPIVYPMALMQGHETPAARSLQAWLAGDRAAQVFKRYGFTVKPSKS